MIMVFTHPNHFAVNNARNLIERMGIQCEVRNEFAGGAIGELAPIDAWPELWVLDDRDYDRAIQLIESAQARADDADWFCGHCGERNAATFELCWNCARERREE